MAARFTLVSWYCNQPCGTRNRPGDIECSRCGARRFERYAQVREQEKAYVDIDPKGNISVPGRLDSPLHPKQLAAGVRRVPVDSAISGPHSLAHLERLGLVHEATNWNSNGGNMSVVAEELPEIKPKSIDQIMSEPDAF